MEMWSKQEKEIGRQNRDRDAAAEIEMYSRCRDKDAAAEIEMYVGEEIETQQQR
jgi:hypothetical protein